MSVDKLDLRIPRNAHFTPEFQRLYRELRALDKGPFHAANHYEFVGDLCEYGFSQRLNLYCRRDKVGNHKIELIGVGKMTRTQIFDEVSRVFDFYPRQATVMRVDFAVDIPDIPIQWFREAVRVKHKRFAAALTSKNFYSEMGNGGIQTLNFGKRPGLIRIYDKTAENRQSYSTFIKSLEKDVEPPSFDSIYGLGSGDRILTRVERQIGTRIPKQIATLADIIDTGGEFMPFAPIKILDHPAQLPEVPDLPFETYCTLRFLRELAQRDGLQAVRTLISRRSNGNPAWAWKKYGPHLPSATHEMGITEAELQARFVESLKRQMTS